MNGAKYFVKTRNWNGKRWVFNALTFTQRFGVCHAGSYSDGDGKFYWEGDDVKKALLIWGYFCLLKPFSGGMTYIRRTPSLSY